MPQGRTAAKLIRFAPDELAAVSSRARACGRTPARFIREAALGAIPKARHNEERDRALLILARLGGQLSVLARRTNGDNQSESDGAQLAAALAEHRIAVRALMSSVLAPRSPTQAQQRSVAAAAETNRAVRKPICAPIMDFSTSQFRLRPAHAARARQQTAP